EYITEGGRRTVTISSPIELLAASGGEVGPVLVGQPQDDAVNGRLTKGHHAAEQRDALLHTEAGAVGRVEEGLAAAAPDQDGAVLGQGADGLDAVEADLGVEKQQQGGDEQRSEPAPAAGKGCGGGRGKWRRAHLEILSTSCRVACPSIPEEAFANAPG